MHIFVQTVEFICSAEAETHQTVREHRGCWTQQSLKLDSWAVDSRCVWAQVKDPRCSPESSCLMPVHINDLSWLCCPLLVTPATTCQSWETMKVRRFCGFWLFLSGSSGAECQTDEQRTETHVGIWDWRVQAAWGTNTLQLTCYSSHQLVTYVLVDIIL